MLFNAPITIVGQSPEEAASALCGNAGEAMLAHLHNFHKKEMQTVSVLGAIAQTFAVFQHFEFNQPTLVKADETMATQLLNFIHNEDPAEPGAPVQQNQPKTVL
ncbi:MAG: hypothetical protein IPK75_20330 [Acidobacteria bacterium]|nr:hypothetical protein [Acidobacteriota bacterium]